MSATLPTYENNLGQIISQAESISSQGPAWLQTLRANALAIHRMQGIPTPKAEDWKYTPLRPIADTNWNPAENGPAVFDPPIENISTSPIQIILVNGRLDRNLTQIPTQSGLIVSSLHDALTEQETLLHTHLGQAANINEHTFAALNTALFTDGLLIQIKKSAAIEPVIEVTHITTGNLEVVAPRILIIAEENSTAKIVERYITRTPNPNLTIPVTEIFAQPYSNLEHVRVQDEDQTQYNIHLLEIKQSANSEVRAYNVAFGAKIGRLDQNIDLQGSHIVSRLDGVVVARDEQLLDNHTKLDHAQPDCNSYEIYKQIIDDNATVVFNGKIYVHQDAQKTDAEQTNQAILLSPTATINSKPQLEIYADDVKCTHGATVGNLEDDLLFYLRSRGMPKEQAEAILVYAFAADVLELISDKPTRDALETRLYTKLGIQAPK